MKCLRIISVLLVLLALTARAVALPPADDKSPKVDAATEAVIKGALKYLASRQYPSGAWSDKQHQVAITGYVLLGFLASGNLPDEGEYGKTVSQGTQFLLNCVRSDGYVIAPSEYTNSKGMYGHGIATIALAELYGQTRDVNIRAKLAKAINLIVTTQNQQGGWRYMPRVADADISVSVLQVVALRAAKNSGIEVPDETLKRAIGYVKSCYKNGGFAYQPGGSPGFARTAAAIYSLQVCGLYDDPMVAAGSKYLVDTRQKAGEWVTYGNFYAAPAQYMVGGEVWADWYKDIHGRLMQKVRRQGDLCSWDTLEDRGRSGMNEIYATGIYTMILSMPYSYIPLYQR